MANILIKIGVTIILVTNLYNPVVNAHSINLKQCFYIITKSQSSKDLGEDLELLARMEIPVFVGVNPNDNINSNIIDVLKEFQEDMHLSILLENNQSLEKTYFAVKGYHEQLMLSGLYNIAGDELVYSGENDISFDVIEISGDPLITMSDIRMKKDDNENYALVVNGDGFNMSTLLLAFNELDGVPLEVSNYNVHIKKPALIYNVFTHVGDATIILFVISNVIFLIAILIFKKWSREKFLD